MRKNLNLGRIEHKIVLWRKITRALKDLYDSKSNVNTQGENKSKNTKNSLI